MNLPFRLYIFCLLLLILTACVTAPVSANNSTQAISAHDADAVKLIDMGEQAIQIAQKSQGVILRQVDTDLITIDYRFVDRAMTKEIIIFAPGLDASPEKWTIKVNTVSPLLTYTQPAINLQNLRLGPNRVAQAITDHWPGCSVRGMNLYLEKDKLTWLAFCNTPEGVVSGSMDNETEVFQPSNAPPASVPAIATPVP
ncbi:MAG: hypothetical protein ACM3PY_19090 [Omnitrophica WOR_2 bacterium]